MDTLETAKALFFEGLRFLEAEDFASAAERFTQALKLVPGRTSILNNLSAVKLQLGKFTEAEEFARQVVAVDARSPDGWTNLGNALNATHRHDEAVLAFDRALQSDPNAVVAWLNKAVSLLALKNLDDALLACNQALKLNPHHAQAVLTQSQILKELKRTDEAVNIYRRALDLRVAASPVSSTGRRATQKAEVLIINPNRHVDDSLAPIEDMHARFGNYPHQLAISLAADFHFNFVFKSDAMRPGVREKIPKPDVIINNNVNAETLLAEGGVLELAGLVDSFGVPVVNHPAQVAQNSRVANVRLLENISGIRVPLTVRFSTVGKLREELVRAIEAQFDYPLITRTLAFQQGNGMNKVNSRADLHAVLAAERCPDEFYVTAFVDSRNGKEFYRKIRAAFVRNEMVVLRVDSDTGWNVHARKSDARVAFYLANTHLLAEEKRICANPEAELGQTVMASLRAIRERIPLDVFGVDFDVAADGSLIFYEANATMNLLTTARKEVAYPEAANDRLLWIFKEYLGSLVAGR
jgi:Flp pilus assembly protein TadD